MRFLSTVGRTESYACGDHVRPQTFGFGAEVVEAGKRTVLKGTRCLGVYPGERHCTYHEGSDPDIKVENP